jgi:hypothetical protein
VSEIEVRQIGVPEIRFSKLRVRQIRRAAEIAE